MHPEGAGEAERRRIPLQGRTASAIVFEEHIPLGVDAEAFKANVETATAGRVQVDTERGVLRARGALTDYDRTTMLLAMPEAAAKAVDALVHKSRGARLKAVEPIAESIRFAVPRLGIRSATGLQLFDRAHFLDVPWKLEDDDPTAILDFFVPAKSTADEAHMDVSAGGQITLSFVTDLHEQLALALQERGWTKNALVNWLDRRLPFAARRGAHPVSTGQSA